MQKRNSFRRLILGITFSLILGSVGYWYGLEYQEVVLNNKIVMGLYEYNDLLYLFVFILFIWWLVKSLMAFRGSEFQLGLLLGSYFRIVYERVLFGGVADYLVSFGLAYNVVDIVIIYAILFIIIKEFRKEKKINADNL